MQGQIGLSASCKPEKTCIPQAHQVRNTVSRRDVARTIGVSLLMSQTDVAPALASKMITLKDGSTVPVYEHGMSLGIVSLKGSIPSDWITQYRATLGRFSGFTLGQRDQLSDIYKELWDPPNTKNSASIADVVTMGDAWLAPAIRAGKLQPIPNATTSRWFQRLSPKWQKLIRRDVHGRVDPNGDVYAAPYKWGTTVIAYRKDRLIARGGHEINTWQDLLQPKLRGRIAMTESSREFIGIALKAALASSSATQGGASESSAHSSQTTGAMPSSGHTSIPSAASKTVSGSKASASRPIGFNSSALDLKRRGYSEGDVADMLAQMRQQIKLFSNRDHVRALTAGDVWAVVGWSRDLAVLAERTNGVELVYPADGSALFADMWAVPSGAQGGSLQSGPSPLLPSWLEFSLMPARAANTSLKTGAHPLLLERHSAVAATSSHDFQHDDLVLSYQNNYWPSHAACLTNSEFLLPLDLETTNWYKEALHRSGTKKREAPLTESK